MDPPIQLHQKILALRKDLKDLEGQPDPENQVIRGLQVSHSVLHHRALQLGLKDRDFPGIQMVLMGRKDPVFRLLH